MFTNRLFLSHRALDVDTGHVAMRMRCLRLLSHFFHKGECTCFFTEVLFITWSTWALEPVLVVTQDLLKHSPYPLQCWLRMTHHWSHLLAQLSFFGSRSLHWEPHFTVLRTMTCQACIKKLAFSCVFLVVVVEGWMGLLCLDHNPQLGAMVELF